MFRNSALLSGLVTQEQLDQALAAARLRYESPGTPTPLIEIDDATLAVQLVAMEILTPYQADQIKAGRTKFGLGPYIITEFIGQGGMGQVYKGVHQMMGRESAI